MARSRELWLWVGSSLVVVAGALAGVDGALVASRHDYQLWSGAPMLGAYAACILGLACLLAAAREWPFPVAADRSNPVGATAWDGPPTIGWVDRAELQIVVSALTDAAPGPVVLTTGLVGAGGFGKTMLAARACQHRAVRRRFPGGVCWITVGRDLDGDGLARRISEAVWNLDGEAAAFTSLEEAGRALTKALHARPRMLLVVDDVWTRRQLAPFIGAGQPVRLLVTTRRPAILAGGAARTVEVDAVPEEVARRILTKGMLQLPPQTQQELLNLAGGWPLLLSLINARLTVDLGRGGNIEAASRGAADRLRRDGPAALDVADAESRQLAVAATIRYSLDTLSLTDQIRYCQLGVFVEDAEIPLPLVTALWRATAADGMTESDAARLCEQLDGLSMLSLTWAGDNKVMVIHDVVRDFARAELGEQRLVELNATLLEAVAAARRTVAGMPGFLAAGPAEVAWWELGDGDRYMWDHLIEHMLEAGRADDAASLATDLRWVGARLERFGPAASAGDLFRAETPRAARLRAVLERSAHMLAPTEPARAVIDVLHSRVSADPDWGPQATSLRDICKRPRLVNRWPLPDLADPSLVRVLVGSGEITALAIAPDGSWLAGGDRNGTVRIWDVATGQEQATLPGHVSAVSALAVAPDGSWLASSGLGHMRDYAPSDGTVEIWDVATARRRVGLKVHATGVIGLAVAPDGSWLASLGRDGVLRIWDVATGRQRAALRSHADDVTVLAVAPDGSWLASGDDSWLSGERHATVRIWDVATKRELAALKLRAFQVRAVAVAPDGSWLASVDSGGTVRIWDVATWAERATLPGRAVALAAAPDSKWLATGGNGILRIWDRADWTERLAATSQAGSVGAVAVAPDGRSLATGGGSDATVGIWDVASGRERAVLTGHTADVGQIAMAPDGRWLASGSDDGTVRIWDLSDKRERPVQTGRRGGVTALAVTPRGTWLATGSVTGVVRIWDVTSGLVQAVRQTYPGRIGALVVAPDGSWLASGDDGATWKVGIWEVATGTELAALAGHDMGVIALAVAPDGRWLASAGGGDRTVRLWDIATGQERATLTGHTGRVRALAMAPNGSWLASGARDATVRIWDLTTARHRGTLRGHVGGVEAVAVAPDGRWLASGGHDGTVRVWDTATWREAATLTGHAGRVTALAVTPDGTWLASGSDDGTVRIWDVNSAQPEALMRLANRVAAATWVSTDTLAIGGPAGLYFFDLLTGVPAVLAKDGPGVPVSDKFDLH